MNCFFELEKYSHEIQKEIAIPELSWIVNAICLIDHLKFDFVVCNMLPKSQKNLNKLMVFDLFMMKKYS